MSSRAGGTEDGGAAAANHQNRDLAIDRKPAAEGAMRLLTQQSHTLVQQTTRPTLDLTVAQNVLRTNFLVHGHLSV